MLWLSDTIPPDKLPTQVKKLEEYGLMVRFRPDVGPHTKLIYSLREFPDAAIVTADDDHIYDRHWLRDLCTAFENDPKTIHTHRAHRIGFSSDGSLLPYGQWDRDIDHTPKPSHAVFPTGVGGVLYPPGSLHLDAIEYQIFKDLCPTNDDFWFKVMALLNGTCCSVVPGKPFRERSFVIREANWSPDALGRVNFGAPNNTQFVAALAHYDLVDSVRQLCMDNS